MDILTGLVHSFIALIFLGSVMLLTCKKIPKYRICEGRYPEHRRVRDNIKYFIIQEAMFTGLFEGATSNRAELDSK